MKGWFFFLFLNCWGGFVRGQVLEPRELFITGIVYDKDSLQPLPDALYHYRQQSFGLDHEGRFSVRVRVGDTLRFSHIGYETREVVVSDSLWQQDYLIGIFLSRDTILLAEVILFPRYFFQGLRLDMNQLRVDNNMKRIQREALLSKNVMDREMNQKMQIEKFARSVEMKGHVDVGFGVGTSSFFTWRKLQTQRRVNITPDLIYPDEVNLLKKIFLIEKEDK